jgi:hypothetical protein
VLYEGEKVRLLSRLCLAIVWQEAHG